MSGARWLAMGGMVAALFGGCASAPVGAGPAHKGPVTGFAVRGARLVSVSTAAVVDAGVARELGLGWRMVDVAFSPTGDLLLAGGIPGKKGLLVRLGVGVREVLLETPDMLDAVACDSGGRIAVGGVDGRVHFVEPSGVAVLAATHHTAPCRDLCVVDGVFVSAGRDGTILFHAPRRRPVQDHTASVECLCPVPVRGDGGRLGVASGARDGKVRLHDRTGRLLRTWPRLPSAVLALAVEPGGSLLAGCADGTLVRLAADRAEVAPVGDLAQPIYALARYRDGWIVGVRDRWVDWVPSVAAEAPIVDGL